MRKCSLLCPIPAGSLSGHGGEATGPIDNLNDEPYIYQNDHSEEAFNTDSIFFDVEHQTTGSSLHARVKEVKDEYDVWQCFVHSYPGEVATKMGQAHTMFDTICAAQEEKGLDLWGPFKNGREWELVRWLMRHVGKSGIEEFTNLLMVTIDHPADLRIILIWLISCMVGP